MKNIIIIVGHYGSGKTEIALNYAIKLSKELKKNEKINLIDLDFVNPYFRSRDFTDTFKRYNIDVISTEEYYRNADMPAISPRVFAALQDGMPTIFDVGGDDAGALALGYFYNYFSKMPYMMWYVVNVNRVMTSTAVKAYEYLKEIENASRLNATHLINNTHLMNETTVDDIVKGDKIVKELSKITNLPIIYTAGKKEVLDKVDKLSGEKFFIKNINTESMGRWI